MNLFKFGFDVDCFSMLPSCRVALLLCSIFYYFNTITNCSTITPLLLKRRQSFALPPPHLSHRRMFQSIHTFCYGRRPDDLYVRIFFHFIFCARLCRIDNNNTVTKLGFSGRASKELH